jgi:siroheme synthase-like protein
MSLLPIFLNLTGRNCLLIGAGSVALDKITSLLTTGLKLRVIAPEARAEIQQLARHGKLEWIERHVEPSDLDGKFLVIAATNSPQVNATIYQGCVQRNIPCNSVDDIPNCDFFFGSLVSRGNLQIAISTSGESPAVAQRLRREIDAQLPDDIGPWLQNLGELRREVLEAYPRTEARKSLLHQLAQRQVCESAACPSRRTALAPLTGKRGAVALVGAGPGDPDLLTVKALRLIQSADVILHDDLVPPAILQLASPSAEALNVGKRCGTKTIAQDEINALMIEHARANRSVVRLKSGDPLIFGRAAEEMASLREADVTFSTGHHAQSHNHSPLPEIEDTTRVVYMPGRDLNLMAEEWLQQGLPPDFPCAVVSHAGQPGEQVQYATLAELGALVPLPAPSVLIAGWTVRNTAAAVQSAAAVDQITA